MRTARLLTVCLGGGCLPRGGGCLPAGVCPGGEGLPRGGLPRGVFAQGGVCLWASAQGEGVCPGGSAQGVSARGVSAQGIVCPGVSAWGGVCLGERVCNPPCGQTDTCENITFANFVYGR